MQRFEENKVLHGNTVQCYLLQVHFNLVFDYFYFQLEKQMSVQAETIIQDPVK